MSLGAGQLPARLPIAGRGLLGRNQDASLDGSASAQSLDPTQQPSFDDAQAFVNSGGLAAALQQNPAQAAMIKQMLQRVAQKASSDQGQLDALAKKLGIDPNASGAGGATASGQAVNPGTFNPAAANALPLSQPSRIGNLADGSGVDSQLAALQGVGGGGGTFEDRVFAIMCQVVTDFQKQIEDRLTNLQNEAQSAAGASQGGQQDPQAESRNIEFEKIKYDMQKLSQMQQAMSNVLDSMNDLAQNAIRKIKGTG